MESENRNLERAASKSSIRSKSFERPEKYEYETNIHLEREQRLEQENRELRLRISQLQNELAEKETELVRLKSQRSCMEPKFDRAEIERYRAAQLQAERLLEAREQSHRQQIHRLEHQVIYLILQISLITTFEMFLDTNTKRTIKSRNETTSAIRFKKFACWTRNATITTSVGRFFAYSFSRSIAGRSFIGTRGEETR